MIEFLIKWRRYFTIAALFSCFVNILQLTFPFYMFTIYNNVVQSYSLYSLTSISIMAVVAIISLCFFSYLRSRILSTAGQDLSLIIRKQVFSVTIKGVSINDKKAYMGGLNDIENLRNFFSSSAVNAVFDTPWSPFYLAIIYLMHPVLGVIATTGALIVIALSVLQEVVVRKSLHNANRINSFNQRFVDSFLRNTEVINGMGMIDAISTRFIAGNNRVIVNQTQSSNRAGIIQAIIKPLQNTIQVLLYCAGAYYGVKEGFNVGLMVASSIIMGRGLGPLMQLMSAWQTIDRAKESYQRLNGISENWLQMQSRSMALPAPRGHVVVDRASYRANDRQLLQNISFVLQPGEFLGVIGPSGAGKSTLCRLLLGIWPTPTGKITLDGMDLFTCDKEMIGGSIGYLPQEIELFSGTVAENIARLGAIDNDKILLSLELCDIKQMVEDLPYGLETPLEGERGLRLSGGQKQKIGLARAVYGNPSLLVLDEPTSNFDEQAEQQFLATLLHLKNSQRCTCIMVTHKPSLLCHMDKVLLLRNGQIALFGTKDEVFNALSNRVHSAKAAQ